MSVPLQYLCFAIFASAWLTGREVLRRQKPGRLPFFDCACLAAVYLLYAGITFNAVGMTHDCEINFMNARMILRGGLLYRDVYSVYGPLGDYLGAGLLYVFGDHRSVLTVFFDTVHLWMLLQCYLFCRRFAADDLAFLLCLFVLACFSTHYNFAYPYSSASFLCYALMIPLLDAIFRILHTPKTNTCVWAGFLAALVFLLRPNQGICLSGIFLLALLHQRFTTGLWRPILAQLSAFAAAFTLIILPVLILFSARMGAEKFFWNFFALYYAQTLESFYGMTFTGTHLAGLLNIVSDPVRILLRYHYLVLAPAIVLYFLYKTAMARGGRQKLLALFCAASLLPWYLVANSYVHICALLLMELFFLFQFLSSELPKSFWEKSAARAALLLLSFWLIFVSFYQFRWAYSSFTVRIQTPHFDFWDSPAEADALNRLRQTIDNKYDREQKVYFVGYNSILLPAIDRMPAHHYVNTYFGSMGFWDEAEENRGQIEIIERDFPILIIHDLHVFGVKGPKGKFVGDFGVYRGEVKRNLALFDCLMKYYEFDSAFKSDMQNDCYYLMKRKSNSVK